MNTVDGLVAVASLAPQMIVNPGGGGDLIHPGGVIDERPGDCGQDGVVGGAPPNPEDGRDPIRAIDIPSMSTDKANTITSLDNSRRDSADAFKL